MNRIPLLQALDGGSLHASPYGSPLQSPRALSHHSSRRKATNRILKNLPFIMAACLFCLSLAYLFQNDDRGILRWKSDRISIDKTPSGEIYQACQSSSTIPLPQLTSVHLWHTSKQLPKESITIVTQLSLERLPMLLRQCQVWSDRIAAAVYLPIITGAGAASAEIEAINGTSIREAMDLLNTFHKKVEAIPNGCALDMQLVVEQFSSWDDDALRLYPFNAIRNRALMMARTDAVLLLDVDFLPAMTFAESYQKHPKNYKLMLDHLLEKKVAIVLPAFETNSTGFIGRTVAMKVAVGGKEHAVSAYRKKEISGFQVSKYELGHSATNYTRWLKTQEPYKVSYVRGYEPYVVMARKYTPFYDERFRGYRYDKITHLETIAKVLKISFEVHPSQFVVHCPHKKAATFKATKQTGQWDRLRDLYLDVHDSINAGDFVPVTSFAKHCPRYMDESDRVVLKSVSRKAIRKSKSSSSKKRKKLAVSSTMSSE